MATIHTAYLGTAIIAAVLPFFLENPKKYWWLGLIAGTGAAIVVDDVLKHLTDDKYCLLCKIITE